MCFTLDLSIIFEFWVVVHSFACFSGENVLIKVNNFVKVLKCLWFDDQPKSDGLLKSSYPDLRIHACTPLIFRTGIIG